MAVHNNDYRNRGKMTGTIFKGIGGFYYVKAEDGQVYECKAKGKFRNDKIIPMIGDYVEIDIQNGKGNISQIKPRKTTLIRPAVANIDKLVVVVSATSPEPNLFLLDKMLVTVEFNNITPIICINKTDILNRDDIEEIYKKAGYDVVKTSAEKNEGIQYLLPYLKNRVTAFAGLSGVGKSSILNIITGIELETGKVSEKIQRGKHTTRHVELIEIDGGGFVVDTPGFSSLEINDIKASDLYMYFPEINKYENMCRFRGCSHISEPDCKVAEGVKNGEISESRYNSYKQLYNHLKTIKEWEK